MWKAVSLAVSKDGRFIAAELFSNVLVWDVTNYEQVFAGKIDMAIYDIDFLPDSTRLVSAGPNDTATIWDFTMSHKVQLLSHGGKEVAAKYSPPGDRIATASCKSIRVWASDNGRLLVDIKVAVVPWGGLLWLNNHLLVNTEDSEVKQINASIGSTVSEWPVPHAGLPSRNLGNS